MLLRKNFRIWKKKRLAECALCMAVAVFGIVLVKLDAFGVEQRLPAADEVEQAFIYMDYPVAVDDAEEVLAIHRKLLDGKEQYAGLSEKNTYNTTVVFRYYMKDGTTFERKYCIPLTEEALQDAQSPASVIRSLESRPEYVRERILDCYSESTSYYAGYVDRIDSRGTVSNYLLQGEELALVLEAIERDIDAGNFNEYLFYVPGQQSQDYYNGISMDFSSRKSGYGTWDYYENYRDYQTQELRNVVSSGNIYVSFGPNCRYTVEILNKLGVFDEQWKLLTVDEYNKLMNY
jgi:ABC-2 type transport system permease protein